MIYCFMVLVAHNFSISGDKWAPSPPCAVLEQILAACTHRLGQLEMEEAHRCQSAQAKAAVLFSASHCGWSGAETQPCLCNGQHPEVLGSFTALQLHPGPQVGK